MAARKLSGDEDALARCIAVEITDVLGDAPTSVKFGAVGLLLGALFSEGVLPDKRLSEYDAFTAVIREQVKKSLG